MAPKPKKTRVRTHAKRHDPQSLHGQKCEVRTLFLLSPYPIFLSCKWPLISASFYVFLFPESSNLGYSDSRMFALKPFLDSTVCCLNRWIRCQYYLRLSGNKVSAYINSVAILCIRKPEGPRANVDFPDSRDKPPTRTKSYGFKEFGYKVSGFVTNLGTFYTGFMFRVWTPKRIQYLKGN